MYCQNCGEKLENGAVFCVKCGNKIERDPIVSNSSKSGNNKSAANSPKLSMKKSVKICGVAVIAIILMLLVANKKTVISLNEYVTVDFSGYDSYGKAEVHFDDKAFIKDYGNTVKYHGSEDEVTAFYKPVEILKEKYITGELDSTERLSNGDTIEFIWDCDDEAAKKNYKSKLKYEDITFTVSGLTNVKKVDPFEEIEVTYLGISPKGNVSIQNNSTDEILKDLHFNAEPYDNLSNGSQITVSVSQYWGSDIVDYYLRNYGIALTQTEKEYTVDGLGYYVTALSEIPDDLIQKMKAQSEDTMKAYVANNWEKQQSLDEMTYLGNYLLTIKDSDSYSGNNNRLFLIYQIKGSVDYEEENIHKDYTYYYFTAFNNITILPDGTCSADLSHYDVPGENFRDKVQYSTWWLDYCEFYFKGYKDWDTLFSRCVTANIEQYNYESNVTDINKVQVDEDADAQQETDEETETETNE